MTHSHALRNSAIEYAARRIPVFPCRPQRKEPVAKPGFHAATTNPETIKRLWTVADRNIGIPTGMVSGLWVFDADGSIGIENLHALEAEHGELPPTLTSASSAGTHFWFKCESPVPSSADGRVGQFLDVRGDGGYVLAPPSVHPDGDIYRWLNDRPPVPAPEWLLRLARSKPEKPKPTISQQALAYIQRPCNGNSGSNRYGLAALEYEVADLASTPPGGRNHRLNRAAFCLYQLVAGGELDDREVSGRLIAACHTNGLIRDDGLPAALATLQSGREDGLMQPRSRGAA